MRSAVLLLVAACGSGTVTQAAFPQAFARAVCQVQAKCRQDARYVEQQCEDDAKSIFDADLPKAVAAGRATFDAKSAQTCLDALNARSCDESQPDIVACQQAVKGALAVGASCNWLYECAQGLCTSDVGATCPAKCGPVSGLGQPCDPPCDARLGLRCIDNACSLPHKADEKCASDTDCASGLWCDGFGKCAARAFAQAACDGDNECTTGLWCDRSPEGGLCRAQVRSAQACTASSAEAILHACVDGDVCRGFTFAKTGATPGICAPTGEVGSSCIESAQVTGCGNGLVCKGGACAEKPTSGPCSAVDDCKDGVAFCDGMQCQLLKAAGAACATGAECASHDCDASSGKCVDASTLCHEP